MERNARILYLHALTPVHSGTGQTVAVIDLPIAREKVTRWPMIPASSLKGVLRDRFRGSQDEDWLRRAFGDHDSAGAFCFGDQRILCLPVRSYYGAFAWVTSPLALTRFLRDLRALEPDREPPFQFPACELAGEQVLVAPGSVLAAGDSRVYLEDLNLTAQPAEAAETAAQALAQQVFEKEPERKAFVSRFAIVSDSVFSFLCEMGTEVSARVRLEEVTKTVAQGGLWYEEAVPAETLFWGPVVVADHRRRQASEYLDRLEDTVVQIGGKSSVGRGLCRVVVR